MSLLTKAQTRTSVRQAIDDPSSKQWSDANLDILISLAQDMIWEAILDSWPWALNNSEALTPAATTGIVDMTTAAKRFYGIQRVTVTTGGAELQPKLFSETVPQSNTYYMLGTNLIQQVVTDGASTLTIDYSFLPTKFVDLSSESTTLTDWPEGHESALIYTAAAWAMTKGDRENMAQIGRIADASVEALLTHISQRYPIPVVRRVQTVKDAILRNFLVTDVPPPGLP